MSDITDDEDVDKSCWFQPIRELEYCPWCATKSMYQGECEWCGYPNNGDYKASQEQEPNG